MIPLHRTQYGVIYTDPPWKYEMRSSKGEGRCPDRHYDCMTLDQLKAMRDEVLFRTAPNAVCVMWSTYAMLPQSLDLMATWGFTYKTGGTWNKLTAGGNPAMGTGYILRSSCEPFLIGTIGRPKTKNKGQRNVLSTPRREHSRKPDEMIGIIESLFDGPYLEMFARTAREGWDSWGNEVAKF